MGRRVSSGICEVKSKRLRAARSCRPTPLVRRPCLSCPASSLGHNILAGGPAPRPRCGLSHHTIACDAAIIPFPCQASGTPTAPILAHRTPARMDGDSADRSRAPLARRHVLPPWAPRGTPQQSLPIGILARIPYRVTLPFGTCGHARLASPRAFQRARKWSRFLVRAPASRVRTERKPATQHALLAFG